MGAADFSNCIRTTVGPVEAEISGSGIPILVLHGSPGGIDAARAMSRFLDKDRYRTICLSRPGYLNTPLPKDHTIEGEVDLLVALLNALHIPRAGVLAWSGGGPPAYMLASRHPDRVSALVSIAALSSSWTAPKTPFIDRILFGTKFGERLVEYASSHLSTHVVREALEGEGSLKSDELNILTKQVLAEPAQRQLILEIAVTMNVGGARRAGWLNDVENFAATKDLGLEGVRCPVLLVHGDVDTDVVPSYSESAHALLLHSEFVHMSRGTHLSFYAHPEAGDIQEKARKWFLDNALS